MAVRATCPKCEYQLDGGNELAEKTVKCPHCSSDVQFPPVVKLGKAMIAVLAIIVESLLFAVIVALLGIEQFGTLLMLGLAFVWGITWIAITKTDFNFGAFKVKR